MPDAARHTSKNAVITCLAPDVCKTPIGGTPVPVPYMIVSRLAWTTRAVPNVSLHGDKAYTMNSRTTRVTGNEPGVAGGIASSVNVGYCRPKTNKSSVFIDGYQLIEHGNLYEMNCNGPEGTSNTLGRLNFVDPE